MGAGSPFPGYDKICFAPSHGDWPTTRDQSRHIICTESEESFEVVAADSINNVQTPVQVRSCASSLGTWPPSRRPPWRSHQRPPDRRLGGSVL